MVTASKRPTKMSLVDTGIEQKQNWACPNGLQHQSQTCLWQFTFSHRNSVSVSSARHTSSRVTQPDAAGGNYNTTAWRCVHNQSTVMAWSTTAPALREEKKMTRWGYISGSGDRPGSRGSGVTRTSNKTPQSSKSEKVGSAEPRRLGYSNTRGVHIKLACLGGRGCIATHPA